MVTVCVGTVRITGECSMVGGKLDVEYHEQTTAGHGTRFLKWTPSMK